MAIRDSREFSGVTETAEGLGCAITSRNHDGVEQYGRHRFHRHVDV